jgi:secretion/DNA translocation related CpaE-like protein
VSDRRSRSAVPSTAVGGLGPAGGSRPTGELPLLVTGDVELAEQVLAVAAVAGVRLQQAPDLAAAASTWRTAPLVVVGADVEINCSAASCRRPALVMVTNREPSADRWSVAIDLGVEQVAVLPQARDWLLARLVDAVAGPGRAAVLGVVGSRGGSGSTTLACALSVTAARLGHDVIMVDADPGGSGLDLVFGTEKEPGLRWYDLRAVRGRMQPGQLHADLPRGDGVRLLSWGPGPHDLGAEAVGAVLATARSECDLVVVDLPRVFDEAGVAAMRACRQVVVVVPAEVRATAAAARVVGRLDLLVPELRLVVRGPAPTGLDGQSIADALQLPLYAELRPEPGLAATLDRGLAPPVRLRTPLGALCRRLVAETMAGGDSW